MLLERPKTVLRLECREFSGKFVNIFSVGSTLCPLHHPSLFYLNGERVFSIKYKLFYVR